MAKDRPTVKSKRFTFSGSKTTPSTNSRGYVSDAMVTKTAKVPERMKSTTTFLYSSKPLKDIQAARGKQKVKNISTKAFAKKAQSVKPPKRKKGK